MRTARSSPSGPRTFNAGASIEHIPPAAPHFLTNQGFASVELDTSVSPEGVYLLRLLDSTIDLTTHIVLAQFQGNDDTDLGICFKGFLSPGGIPSNLGQFTIARFQVIPGNVLANGPFSVLVSPTGPIVT